MLVDSLCSGVNVLMTPALIGLMILQSAAETPVAAAEAVGEEAGVLAAADVVAAAPTPERLTSSMNCCCTQR